MEINVDQYSTYAYSAYTVVQSVSQLSHSVVSDSLQPHGL